MSRQVATRKAQVAARVLVIEDHPLYRFALETAMRRRRVVRLVGSAGDAEQGVALARKLRPDVVLLDVHLPGRDGLSILGELTRGTHAPRVLVLSADEDPAKVAAALRGGAAGYLSKDIDGEGVLKAIAAAMRGETVVARRLQRQVLAELCRPTPTQTPILSERELEILSLTAAGYSRRQIAEALFLGPSTVKAHLSGLYLKLGVRDRAAAVARAISLGVLSVDQGPAHPSSHRS